MIISLIFRYENYCCNLRRQWPIKGVWLKIRYIIENVIIVSLNTRLCVGAIWQYPDLPLISCHGLAGRVQASGWMWVMKVFSSEMSVALLSFYFFVRTKGRDHRGGRAVHGYSCSLSRENFRFSLRPSAPTWQGFHKLSSTSKPQLVVLMISPTHLPNYPVKSADRPGCSQSTPNCTLNVEHEWRTWGEVQPERVLVKGTAEDCLWALPRRVAVVEALM